jgi:release factor glutamine methyltransferase
MSVGHWGEAFPADRFDLIVSNPPYIETSAIDDLAAEVRDHDPLAALDGGVDGLACYRDIATAVPRLLASGGVVAVEVGRGQAPAVADLLAAEGLAMLRIWTDLGGIDRVVVAKKSALAAA